MTVNRDSVDFTVKGTPVAQGSMVVMRGRVRHSESDRLNGWRNDIAAACLKEMRDTTHWKPEYLPQITLWEGPVSLELYFTYRPKKKAESETQKMTAPDLDKLSRAVLDALTGVLYVDDKQVSQITAYKSYGIWDGWEGGPETTKLSAHARLLS